MMDAGTVIFAPGTRLDLKQSMGFKNERTYCVAPITMSNGTMTEVNQLLATYDFWAVGMDCCSGNTADFHCGQFANINARGGLRLMRDGQRPYYRLAVQQAEAAYGIKAAHPLFFTWMQDPMEEVNKFQNAGIQSFLLSIMSMAGMQLFLVLLSTVVFARLGKL